MANKLYEEASISAIADAIRAKAGGTDRYTVADMAEAIRGIAGGGGATLLERGSFQHSGGAIVHELTEMPDMVFCYLDEAADYSGQPTKCWVLLNLAPMEGKYGFVKPNPAGNIQKYESNAALQVRGAKGTNTIALATATVNAFGKAKDTLGMDTIFIMAQSSSTYPVIEGTYHYETYKLW